MRHKTWFRLVVKAIGVLLVGLGVPELLSSVLQALLYFRARQASGGFGVPSLWFLPGTIGSLAKLGLGLYLLFGARWIVDKAIPSNRPYCPECGYDVSRAPGAACPECGSALPAGEHAGT